MLDFLESLDHRLFWVVNQGLAAPVLDPLFWTVSVLASAGVLLLLVGTVLWCVDRPAFRQHFKWIVLAVLTGGLVVQALKYGLGRPRPLSEFAALIEAGDVHVRVLGRHLNRRSFPSGHTQAAASVFVYLLGLYPRRWVFWGVAILLVALSRVYVGAHFPADVGVGALLGGLTALGCWRLQRHVRARALGGEPTP